jgi:DNA-binding transcriptional MerR regulator
MRADAWEPVDFLAEFREREVCLREVKELLNEEAQSETGKLWAHHLPRIVGALDFFQGLLQDEIDHIGEWRYHEFQHDEVLDFIDEDLDKLSEWLSRMTNTPLPTQ